MEGGGGEGVDREGRGEGVEREKTVDRVVEE